ncbi:MAG: hypothetical protein AAB425_13955, partial [Bdellovibrionota bacterium]
MLTLLLTLLDALWANATDFDPQCLGKKKHGYQKREIQKMKVSSGRYITMVRGDVQFPAGQGGGKDDAVVITFPEGGTFVRRIRDLLGTQHETFIYDNRYFEIFKSQGRFVFYEISDAGHLKRARKRETKKQQQGSRQAFDASWDSSALAPLRAQLASELPECATKPRAPSPGRDPGDGEPGDGEGETLASAPGESVAAGTRSDAITGDRAVAAAATAQVCEACKVNGDQIDAALANDGETVVCGPGSMAAAFAKRAFCDPWTGGWHIVNPYAVYAATLRDKPGATVGEITADCKAYLLKYAELHKGNAVAKADDPNATSMIDNGARLSGFAAGGCYDNLFTPGKLEELRSGLGDLVGNDPAGTSYCSHLAQAGSGRSAGRRAHQPQTRPAGGGTQPGGAPPRLETAAYAYHTPSGARGGGQVQT